MWELFGRREADIVHTYQSVPTSQVLIAATILFPSPQLTSSMGSIQYSLKPQILSKAGFIRIVPGSWSQGAAPIFVSFRLVGWSVDQHLFFKFPPCMHCFRPQLDNAQVIWKNRVGLRCKEMTSASPLRSQAGSSDQMTPAVYLHQGACDPYTTYSGRTSEPCRTTLIGALTAGGMWWNSTLDLGFAVLSMAGNVSQVWISLKRDDNFWLGFMMS